MTPTNPRAPRLGRLSVVFLMVAVALLGLSGNAVAKKPPANQAPVLQAIPDKSIPEGQLLRIQLVASDPDGDSLTYSVSSLPAGAQFDTKAGTFTWIPTFQQSGTYNLTFSASDGSLIASRPCRIVVADVPQPLKNRATIFATVVVNPLAITMDAPARAPKGQPFYVSVTVRNASGTRIDTVGVQLVLPSGMSFVSGSTARQVVSVRPYSRTTVLWRVHSSSAGTYLLTATMDMPGNASAGTATQTVVVQKDTSLVEMILFLLLDLLRWGGGAVG
jgi:uncharacterized repeat protein (TIGR01451 family)